jgi:TatD DNase family protein
MPVVTKHPALIDIGLNLGHDSFDHDRHAVLAAARAVGVVQMILTGTSVEGSHKAAELAAEHPGLLYSTAGVHPHEAERFTMDSSAELQRISKLPQVVAIGETGLDFFRDFSPRDTQEAVFAEQLDLGVAAQLPVFLHQRDAHHRFLPILKERRDRLTRAVVHCFTGTREELYDYLDLDCYIGITGWVCDERRGLHVQELLRDIPANRLMLETDAPYLQPRTMHPKPKTRRNEPANLTWVLATVAQCLQKPMEEIAAQTTANARVFFNL